MLNKNLFLSFLLTMVSALSIAESDSTDIIIGKRIRFHSNILNEDREIQVYLPDSYADYNYTKYPTVYLLDGHKYFNSFSGVVGQLSADATPQIPEMIVVGISTAEHRVRDASPTHSLIGYRGIQEDDLNESGGADLFLRFIKEELIPKMENTYRTNGYKIFVGYSFTGTPVLHSLYTQPDLFNAYISIDLNAWWDHKATFKNYADFLKTSKSTKPIQLYISTEERVPNTAYPEKENTTWTLIKTIEKKHPANLNLGYKKYKIREENHHTMPLISFMDALKHIFAGYMINYDEMYDSPYLIKIKLKKLSEKLGYSVVLSEEVVNHLGYQFLYTLKDNHKALFYFVMNTENYPQSSNAFDSLAEVYKVMGDKEKAKENYTKALLLDPKNENSKKMLEELNSK